MTAFMASVGKVAAFAALLRVFVVGLPFFRDDWRPAIWVLAVLSLVVGSFLAVVQTDVKRMLAYSSISHAGFILVGVEAAGHRAGEADSGLGVPERARVPAGLRRASSPARSASSPSSPGGATAAPTLDAFRGLGAAPPAARARPDGLARRPGRRAVHVRVHRQVRRDPRRRRRAQLRAGDHRHGDVGRGRLPLPADHGQRVDGGRPGAGRGGRDPPARAVLGGPGDLRSPPRSRSSSGSSPSGCSTPPSTTTQFAR